MANLQQAMSAMKNERAPKAARTTKGKDGKGQARPQSATNSQASTAGTTDTTLIHGLARLTLQQQPQLRAAFDANSITFLIQPEETKNELNDLVTTWFNDLQGQQGQDKLPTVWMHQTGPRFPVYDPDPSKGST